MTVDFRSRFLSSVTIIQALRNPHKRGRRLSFIRRIWESSKERRGPCQMRPAKWKRWYTISHAEMPLWILRIKRHPLSPRGHFRHRLELVPWVPWGCSCPIYNWKWTYLTSKSIKLVFFPEICFRVVRIVSCLQFAKPVLQRPEDL